MKDTIAGYVTLTLRFEREGGCWVGVCLELGTSTFADSLRECHIALEELVVTDLNVLEETGERKRFFDEWGIRIHSDDKPEVRILQEPRESITKDIAKSDHACFAGPFIQSMIFQTPPPPMSDPRKQLVKA